MKRKIKNIRGKKLVIGDPNLLGKNEILVKNTKDAIILTEKNSDGYKQLSFEQQLYSPLYEDLDNIVLVNYNTKKQYTIIQTSNIPVTYIPNEDFKGDFRFTIKNLKTGKDLVGGILGYKYDDDHSVDVTTLSIQKTTSIFKLYGEMDEEEGACGTSITFGIHDEMYPYNAGIKMLCKILRLKVVIQAA